MVCQLYPPIKSVQKGGFPTSEFCSQVRLLNCHCIKLECIICTSLATFGTMEIIGLLCQSMHLVPGNFLQHDSARVKLNLNIFVLIVFYKEIQPGLSLDEGLTGITSRQWGERTCGSGMAKREIAGREERGVVLCLPTHNCSTVMGLLIEAELCVFQVFSSD